MTFDPVRNASDILALEQGCYFDEAAGLRPIKFIETFCRQSKGRWVGQPLKLLDWQKDFLMRLFGWRRTDGRRRFRRFYLEIAKKNGKSTLLAAQIARIWTDEFKLLLRGSMNLNFNPRFEQFDLTEGGEDFDLVERIESELRVLPREYERSQAAAVTGVSRAFETQQLEMFRGLKVWAK